MLSTTEFGKRSSTAGLSEHMGGPALSGIVASAGTAMSRNARTGCIRVSQKPAHRLLVFEQNARSGGGSAR